jgi:hypothetical protein
MRGDALALETTAGAVPTTSKIAGMSAALLAAVANAEPDFSVTPLFRKLQYPQSVEPFANVILGFHRPNYAYKTRLMQGCH